MKQIVLQASAKINLSLDITGRRADGYHELDTVMQSVSLADTVELSKTADGTISVRCDDTSIPQGGDNIAHRAALAYFDAAGLPAQSVSVFIRKRIPSQAGLGGGSADAAAVLHGLCALFSPLPEDALLRAGASAGADVPFCLTGGTLRARGIGELLSPVPVLPACPMLIVKPPIGMSTAAAYAAYDHLPTGCPPRTGALLTALEDGSLDAIGAALDNAFANASPLPAVESIRRTLRAAGAVGACMSGSGTAVFGLFADEHTARHCAGTFDGTGVACFLCHPVSTGCIPVSA